jgi:metallophosphoesterase (TIGR00282 family)
MAAKILFFGDIIGKPGRRTLAQVLPSLREHYKPDLVVANVENLAHGKGVTLNTLKELEDLGVEVFTSGNHVFDKEPGATESFREYPNLIRPFNYDESLPGRGWCRVEKNGANFCVINLGGKVFFEGQYGGVINNPFFALEEALKNAQKNDIILVDFHAEATSEKNALGLYADGRVAALVGTHTHVPTADYRILPNGTGYVTDAGMTGPQDSVIGAQKEIAFNLFLEKGKFRMEVEEDGPMVVNAVLITVEHGLATNIEPIRQTITLK